MGRGAGWLGHGAAMPQPPDRLKARVSTLSTCDNEVRQRTRVSLGREVRRLPDRWDGGGGTRRGSHGRGVHPDRATGRDLRRARVAVSAPDFAGPGMVRTWPGDNP